MFNICDIWRAVGRKAVGWEIVWEHNTAKFSLQEADGQYLKLSRNTQEILKLPSINRDKLGKKQIRRAEIDFLWISPGRSE